MAIFTATSRGRIGITRTNSAERPRAAVLRSFGDSTLHASERASPAPGIFRTPGQRKKGGENHEAYQSQTAKARRAHRSRWLWLWNRRQPWLQRRQQQESRLEEPRLQVKRFSQLLSKSWKTPGANRNLYAWWLIRKINTGRHRKTYP